MKHIPYGYRIENGRAVIDEEQAATVREFFQNYISGMALMPAAENAGLKLYHGSAGRMLRNKKYLGAKLTPWLWAGGTKEVRTSTEMCRDPGRHGRCAAIDGWVYTRPCKTESTDVLFRIPITTYFRTRYRKMLMTEAHSSEIET